MNAILDWLRANTSASVDLCLDSRQIAPGGVFLACPGVAADGREHIPAALRAGAGAIVYEADGAAPGLGERLAAANIKALAVSGLRGQVAELAAAWYGRASSRLTVIAVTGTNGKTSCTQWIAQALTANRQPCGVIGTLGVRFPDGDELATGLTTPDVVTLHKVLARMADAGATAVAIEASSIGIEQGRLDGVEIDVAAFTNLTQDHLDVHGTMAAYEAAKARLFAWPGLGAAVVNLDDAVGRRLAAQTVAARVSGYCRTCDDISGLPETLPVLRATDAQATANGALFTLATHDGAEALIRTPFAGHYNIDNLLLVAGVLRVLGWPVRQVAAALGALAPVPGRLEVVSSSSVDEPMVVVDYAHTPDALRGVLAALRPVAQARGGKLFCVFGCGGDRDAGKRGPMGHSAITGADVVVVTSDNPRHEDPLTIIDQILGGAGQPAVALARGARARLMVEPRRARAILGGIWAAQPEDVVLVAGKGHETTQEVAGVSYPFSDREWARLALALPQAAAVTTDTRQLGENDLFVALGGENFDGHDFVEAAAAAGACAAVLDRPVDATLPGIVVGDTREALLHMAAAWRSRHGLPLIAVTGSNGKTTTKEMIASILAAWLGSERTLATKGNLNNEIGVPLTLLRLQDSHLAAVVELGMNHPGEIAVLAEVAAPTIALVNNAQREHQEFMHSVEAVARENGAALLALPPDGVAVYPGDDEFTSLWDEYSGTRRRLRFGFADDVDITARDVYANTIGTRFTLATPQGGVAVALPVAGRHNLRNALAAAACALAAGCPLAAVAKGLESFKAVNGRLQQHRLADGTVLIDDTYNANPDSTRAAIDVLASLPAPRALVLGDMGEVGADGPAMHREVGAYARERGVDHLLALGTATRDSVDAFGPNALLAESPEAVAALLRSLKPAAVLVKGSRFMRMERVVAALLESDDSLSRESGHVA